LRSATGFAFVGVLCALSACVEQGDAGATSGTLAANPVSLVSAPAEVQPRQATYRCDDGGVLTVENLKSSVTLTDAQGDIVTLPAAPAAQQSRYGQEGYALVLEGRDALYMKGGKEPLNCRR